MSVWEKERAELLRLFSFLSEKRLEPNFVADDWSVGDRGDAAQALG
jgi:hypothetical protein